MQFNMYVVKTMALYNMKLGWVWVGLDLNLLPHSISLLRTVFQVFKLVNFQYKNNLEFGREYLVQRRLVLLLLL